MIYGNCFLLSFHRLYDYVILNSTRAIGLVTPLGHILTIRRVLKCYIFRYEDEYLFVPCL